MDAPDERATPAATDRRTFLGSTAALATVALFPHALVGPLRRWQWKPTLPGQARRTLSALEWSTLAAATARLLPSTEGSPGASDVNAVGWIDVVLADPGIGDDDKRRVRESAAALHAFAHEKGAEDYATLPEEAQDEGLRRFERDWEGQLKLRLLIAWTLEAFLGDPVHGVNPDRVGWTWAEVRPGVPRPTEGWRPLGEGPQSEGDR